jgi:hypothetical protein
MDSQKDATGNLGSSRCSTFLFDQTPTDSQWLVSIGGKKQDSSQIAFAGWLVFSCDAGKWNAYSVRSSHWHLLVDADRRCDVYRLLAALNLLNT